MFRWLVLCSLLTFIQSATIPPNIDQTITKNLIVGGFPIDISLIPYQVSVLLMLWHHCGGTLISPLHVISAANCIYSDAEIFYSIRIGSNYAHEGGIVIPVERIINHPRYDSITFDYDITIIVMSESQTWTTNFPKLPASMTQFEDGAVARVSGWGDTKNPAEFDDLLRATYVPIINQEFCKLLCGRSITDRMLCAGSYQGGVGPCDGDAGGPLILNGTLIGVVSWSKGGAQMKYPGVYTSVSSVVLWIAKTIGM